MPSEFDLLVEDIVKIMARKDAATMAKAAAAEPCWIQPLPAAARRTTAATPRPPRPAETAPAHPAVERRLAMLAAADKAEAMAKSMTAAGKLTGPESRLISLQIAQVRADAGAIR